MTSAAGASAVPAVFDASMRAAVSSFFTVFLTRVCLTRAQLVELRQRQRGEPIDDELSGREFSGRIAVRHANQSETRAACGFETPARVLDGNRASRIEGTTCPLAQLLEREAIRRRRRFALRCIAGRDDRGEEVG